MERQASSVSSDGRGDLRARQREAVRQELRDAAFELFDRQGFAATTVDEIARAAGVSRSTFFRYFGSKEAIVAGEADEGASLYLRLLEERPAGEGRMEALERALMDLAHIMRSDERREEMLLRERIVDSDTSLSAAREATTARFRLEVARILAVRDGRTSPDLEDALAAAILSQITDHIGARWRSEGDRPPVGELISSHFETFRRLAAS